MMRSTFTTISRWSLYLCLLYATGCARSRAQGSADQPYETLEIRAQSVPGAVLYTELAEELGYLAPLKLKYIGSTFSGPQDIQTVATGDADIGQAFNGAIAKMVAAGAPIRALVGAYGIDEHTWGGFFVKEDSPIRGARDLIGKKLAVNTLGAHQELVLREYLSRAGLTREEIAQVTLVAVPLVNAEQLLRQGQVDAAMLQSIFRDKAVERGGVRPLFSDYDLFGRFTAGSFVTRLEFIEKNPKTAAKLVDGIARAIEWARAQPREAVIAKKRAILAKRKRNEDDSFVQYWKSAGIANPGGVISPREFQVWLDWLQKDGQLKSSSIPLSRFYTNELNPFYKPQG